MSTVKKNPISFIVSAPGKIILHGEHSVVYGKTALAASIDLRTTVSVSSLEEDHLLINFPKINYHHSFGIEEIKRYIECVHIPLVKGADIAEFNIASPELISVMEFEKILNQFVCFKNKKSTETQNALVIFLILIVGMFGSINVNIESVAFTVDSELSIGAGTGSSASFSVSLAGAVFQLIRNIVNKSYSSNVNISKDGFKHYVFPTSNSLILKDSENDLISRWAFLCEKIVHGNPSGIDNNVCTYGSVIQFKKCLEDQKMDIKRIHDIRAIKILLVDTKVSRNTLNMVKKVALRKERHPKTIDSILEALDNVALTAADVLKGISRTEELTQGIECLEELFDINQGLLVALGVSHPTLNKICDIGLHFGLHCKLTGAGGGGYAIMLLPPDISLEKMEEVQKTLIKEGFGCMKTELGAPGVYIEQLL